MKILLFCAYFLLGPPLSAQTIPQVPPRQPVNQRHELFQELLDRTPWEGIFEELFLAPFDAEKFWRYPLDRLPDGSGTYSGMNQYGQTYYVHVHALTDLGLPGPDRYWQAEAGLETSVALIETLGLVVDNGQQALFLPVQRYNHWPSDYGTGRDCTPPPVDSADCDVLPCDRGGVKFLDEGCVDIAGRRFKTSCEWLWGVYDAQVEAAQTRWNSCTNLAFGAAAACYLTTSLSFWWTFGLGPPLGAVACTVMLNAQLDNCDEEYRAATKLAQDLRDLALKATLESFETDILLCCKDCPPLEKQQKPEPKRRP